MNNQWTLRVGVLVVMLVGISAFTDRNASPRRMATGTVVGFHPGDWMLVTNGGMRLPVALHQTTTYGGDRDALTAGTRVTVWYRNVAERRLVADRVQVHAEPSKR